MWLKPLDNTRDFIFVFVGFKFYFHYHAAVLDSSDTFVAARKFDGHISKFGIFF